MGRHSLPHASAPDRTGGRSTARRRTVVISAVLVLAMAAGTAVALSSGLRPFGGSCDGEDMPLRVAASPDIAPALRTVADRARDSGVRTDGRCLDVRVTARPAHEVVEELTGPRSTSAGYEVWLPDSGLWVDQARASGTAPALGEGGNVASSPLALAAVPSAAEKLGWPDKTYTWAGLAEEAQREELPLGVADPDRSAVGLLSLARLGASSKDSSKEEKSGGETLAAGMARKLAGHTEESDEQVLASLPRAEFGADKGDPSGNPALIVSEQAAHQHNTGGFGGDLRLFYPEDGSAQLDYPYTLVGEDTLTSRQTRAATRFMTLLGTGDSLDVLRDHGFRTGGLPPKAAAAWAAGAKEPQPYDAAPAKAPTSAEVQATLGLWAITVKSARLTAVVDASDSMSAPVPGEDGRSRMDVTRGALFQALSTFKAEDEIGLWDFARRLDGSRDYRRLVPTQRLDERTDGRTQRERLTAAVEDLDPVSDGATGLYDTVLATYREAAENYGLGRFNVVVLLTDGSNQDPGSISRDALVGKLRKLVDPQRPLPLIAIAVGPDADKRSCEEMAKATGGSAFRVEDPAEIHQVMLRSIMAAARR
ncbi:substrate-binding and VWA domain-containing protein [Streptomyces sp. NPDC047108]|uniref:substrate-binding and VWA domain-containing protein n=1 Tax=Streptomyces sp. NPDC047108 TaxID=3155025 RepID=UPI0033D6FC81